MPPCVEKSKKVYIQNLIWYRERVRMREIQRAKKITTKTREDEKKSYNLKFRERIRCRDIREKKSGNVQFWEKIRTLEI